MSARAELNLRAQDGYVACLNEARVSNFIVVQI